MTPPSEPKGRAVTVTIKYGAGYDQTWVSFSGLVDEVRDDIAAFFGIEPENETSLTVSDLVINATTTAHAVSQVATNLGATVVRSEPTASASATAPNAGGNDPWTQAQQGQQDQQGGDAPSSILDLIGKAADLRALQRLWADNQAAFADPEVLAAWKAKGRTLQAATPT